MFAQANLVVNVCVYVTLREENFAQPPPCETDMNEFRT